MCLFISKSAQRKRGGGLNDIQKVIWVSCRVKSSLFVPNLVILINGKFLALLYMGHVNYWGGGYFSALESMSNRNHVSVEQNINKVLWPVAQ